MILLAARHGEVVGVSGVGKVVRLLMPWSGGGSRSFSGRRAGAGAGGVETGLRTEGIAAIIHDLLLGLAVEVATDTGLPAY